MPRGISLLVVEKGTAGFTVDRTLAKMGWHCSDTAELGFASCRVPVANLVGAEGSGFAQIAEQFVVERIALAVHGYGIAARSLALTAAYVQERQTFGRPLVGRQVVRHQLVEMHRQVDVARTYTRAIAARHVAGEDVVAEACLAKQTAVEAAARGVRPGRPAARRHGVPPRHGGGAALPRRADPAHRRRCHRGAHRPGRPAPGVLVSAVASVPDMTTSTVPLRPQGRVHIIGAGPVGLFLAALLQGVEGQRVRLYERRSEYTRTRMVSLAKYLVADSIESYKEDEIDGQDVEALFDPVELQTRLAYRRARSPPTCGPPGGVVARVRPAQRRREPAERADRVP